MVMEAMLEKLSLAFFPPTWGGDMKNLYREDTLGCTALLSKVAYVEGATPTVGGATPSLSATSSMSSVGGASYIATFQPLSLIIIVQGSFFFIA